VVQQMQQAKIIHFATHGLLETITGEVPGALALAPSSSDAGWLSASEIGQLKLQADLVVLSACDTGRGRITGDGVIGLSRSFLAAGVPDVVVSLWQVPDEPTRSLMVNFYQHLQTGKSNRAQALRQAMLAQIKQTPDPVDWAAFTLVGGSDRQF
jgi:CHAT domain-containing protein